VITPDFYIPDHLEDNRKKNWNQPKVTFGKSRIETYSHGRYSSRCSYERLSYTKMVEAWGKIVNPTKLFVRIDSQRLINKIITAPRGWEWGSDQNGIKLVKVSSPKIEYHPTAAEFYSAAKDKKVIQGFTKKAKELHQKRQQTEKAENTKARVWKNAIATAIRRGDCVTVQDSLIAGNCSAGTLQFCHNHGISGYVTVKELTRKFPEIKDERLKLAVLSSIRRNNEDYTRGYCIIKKS
jgi:hypothetical protein